MKKTLKKFLVTSIIAGSLFVMPCASAAVYEADGEYTMSKYETQVVAEQRAVKDAERYAIEQAGVYIESYSKRKNFNLLEDEVITIASSVLKHLEKPVLVPTFVEGGNIKISAHIKVEISDADIEKYLNNSIANRTQINSQLEDLRKANAEQERRIKELEAQIANTKTVQQEEQIKQQFANEDKIFLANQKIEEGWKFWGEKNFNKALESFNEAINLNPQSAEAYAGRGTAYANLEQFGETLSDLSKAVELNPNDIGSEIFMDIIYQTLNIRVIGTKEIEPEIALQYYNRAIQLNPKSSVLYNYRGYFYHHYLYMVYDANTLDKAIADYTKAIELNQNFAESYYNRGLVYDDLKNYDAAIADYNQAIKLNPNDAKAYNNRGNAYKALKNYDAAIADYNNAIKINPNYANAYYNRGIAYKNLKQYQKAVADFTKRIELDSKFMWAYVNRAECYKALGETKKAAADFAKARELGYKG